MKLYWGPHTCAIGIHVLLEEIGIPYETEKVDVEGGATRKPPFTGINPKGKVPTLVRDDGTVLTEFSAIATWLARTSPEAGLMPDDVEQEVRLVEMMAYIEGTIHGQGYGRIFSPASFEPQDIVHQTVGLGRGSVESQGRDIVRKGFAILDPQLARHPFAIGDRFTIADAALFYIARWAPDHDVTLPVNVASHLQRMRARPKVHKILKFWDEA